MNNFINGIQIVIVIVTFGMCLYVISRQIEDLSEKVDRIEATLNSDR